MKNRFPSRLVVTLMALAGVVSARAATYSFTGTTPGGGSFSWSTGTGWNATPVSGTSTRLSLFTGIGFAAGSSGTYSLINDFGGNFVLNRLDLAGTGNSGAGTTNINVSGNTLSFVSTGGTSPVIDIASTSFAGGNVNYTVSNNLNFVDDTTVLSGTTSNNLGATFTLTGTFSGNGNFVVSSTTPNGSNKVIRVGTAANNTRLFGGDLVVNGGQLTLNPAAAAGYQFYTRGNLELNGGILDLQGTGATLSVLGFSGTGGSIAGINTGHTLVVNAADPTATSFGGSVQLDTNVHYLGAGELTMPAVSSGGLRAGSWQVGGSGTLRTPGIVQGIGASNIMAQGTFEVTGTSGNVLGDVTSDLNFYGGALSFAPGGSGANVTVQGQVGTSRIFLNSHSAIELDKGNNTSLAVNLGSTSAVSVINRVSAPGTLIIKPASGLANLGTASGESLRVVGSSSLAPPTVTNGIVGPWLVGQDTDGKGDFLTYSGSGAVTDTGFVVANYSATNTFAGATANSVIKVTSAQTVTADTSVYGLRNDSTITINASRFLTLELNNAGLIMNGGTIEGPGTFRIGVNTTHSRTATIYTGLDGGTISSTMQLTSQGATTFSDITGNVALTKFGEGTLVLSGSVTNIGGVTGQMVINEGAVRFNANMSNLIGAAANPTIVLNGGVLETSGTFNRALTTTGNSTGGVNLSVNARSPGGGFSAGGGNLSVNLGGSGSPLTWNSTNFIRDYGQLIFGSRTADGVVDFQNGIELGANSAAYFRQIDVKDNVNSSADRAIISGLIADSSGGAGLHGVQKVGQGTLVFTANNSYAGITAVSSGTLQLGYVGTVNAQSYDGTTGTVAGDVHNYGTLAFHRSNAHTFGNTISGTGDVAHNGSGTTSLTAANTYSGGTEVHAGTLLVNNMAGSGLGTGDVLVDGGTLGGSGSFIGDVLVTSGGVLSPGNSIESLGSGSIAFDGGTFEFEINTTLVEADLLYGGAGSTLSLTNSPTLTLSDLGSNDPLTLGTKFTLMSYDGAWNGGTFVGYADDSTFSFAGNTWQIDYNDAAPGVNFLSEATLDGTSFVTITTVVPEPSSMVLLGFGLAAAIHGFRRRR